MKIERDEQLAARTAESSFDVADRGVCCYCAEDEHREGPEAPQEVHRNERDDEDTTESETIQLCGDGTSN